jgi:hypothetical protein
MQPENYLDIENNPTWRGMQEMTEVIEDLVNYCLCIRKANDLTAPPEVRSLHFVTASQHTRLAMFCSAPGLGKTFLGRKILRKAGLRLPPHELVPTNVVALTYELWRQTRNGFEVAVIDDADRLMRSDSMIGVMKTAWNQDNPSVNCFLSEKIRKNEQYRLEGSPRYNPDVPPPSFPYRQACAWFANKNVTTPSGLAEHTAPDFSALVSRGLHPRWINSEPRNVFLYTLWMIAHGNLFVSINLKLDEAEETLAFFMDAALRLQHPNPNLRLAVQLAKARKTPQYKTLWARIIAESLAASDAQPRAITESDLKLKPDLRKMVEAGRAEAARRKAAADRAIADAREAARLAESLAEARRIEAERKIAEEITKMEPDDESQVTAKTKADIPQKYVQPPGHVFPPAEIFKFPDTSDQKAAEPRDEPGRPLD